MANEKISQLTPGAPAQSTDLIPIARSGANYSLQVSDVLTAPVLNGTTEIAPQGTATSLANFSSNLLELVASYFNGGALSDTWTVENVIDATGATPKSTLQVTHSGSTGFSTVMIPGGLQVGNNYLNEPGIISLSVTNNPISLASAEFVNMNSVLGITTAGSNPAFGTFSKIVGLDAVTLQTGDFYGVFGNVQDTTAGGLTNAYGVVGRVDSSNGGNIVLAVGMYAGTPFIATGGTIAQAVGVLIAAQAEAGITTAYAIKQLGASDINSFAGVIQMATGKTLSWNSDTGISRDSAGVIDIGNGTQGDKSGTLNVATFGGAPNFSGAATGQTAAAFDNSTKLDTTAYADNNFKGVSVAGFREDFISNGVASPGTIAAGTGVQAYDTPWQVRPITGGTTGTIFPATGAFQNPGQILFTTVATSGDGLVLVKNEGSGAVGALGSAAGWEINMIFKLGQTTNCAVRAGVIAGGQFITDPPTDGIYVEFDTANTGNTDTDFTWVTRKASTPNYSTSHAIAADTSFHHFRIRSTSAGTILFSVDGGTEASVATDVPTTVLTPCIQFLPRANGAVTLTFDFYSFMCATGRT